MPSLLLILVAAVPPAEFRYDDEIREAIADVAHVYPVTLPFVRAVIKQESAFNPKAVSSAGAVGLMQVMPFNAQRLGVDVRRLSDPRVNILAGTRLLAALLRHYRGDVIATLVAYNAGPRGLLAPVPSNGETPAYVLAVLRFWREYASPSRGARLARTSGTR